MRTQAIQFHADCIELAGEIYYPDAIDLTRSVLCICHGIPATTYNPAERGYAVLAERLCATGFVTFIFNFRGAGLSKGNLDPAGWTHDLTAAIDVLHDIDTISEAPLCVIGFSGGAVTAVYVAAHDSRVASVIACACPSRFSFLTDEKQVQSMLDHFRGIGAIRDDDFPSSPEEWIDGFKLVSSINWIDKISPRPLLLIHGDKDEVVDVEQAFELFAQAKEPKELEIIPEAGHRLRIEEKAVDKIIRWLLNCSSV